MYRCCNYYSSIILCYIQNVLGAPCARGYERKYGSNGGDKKTLLNQKHSENVGVYSPTENECRIRCDNDQQCKTYEYSPEKNDCVMRNVTNPTNNRSYEDYRWCSKSNIFVIFNFSTFQKRIGVQY